MFRHLVKLKVHLNSPSFQPPLCELPKYRLVPVRMVEGHGCHRVAHAHRKLLLTKSFTATSPNGRFADGAKAINGKPLARIEVHGKNLFYFFGPAEQPEVVHIHFGMSGAFKTMTLPGPDPTETTRLQLVNEGWGIVAHLSAMTVAHGDLDFYHKKASALGPDPLREDADAEKLWLRMHGSKKPVGLMLMDQSAVAGVGNIYRAEILFKAGVHPEQPSNTVDRAAFERIWRHCVLLLQRGFKTGSILTVDPEEADKLGRPWTRRYIYNHSSCGRCGSSVRTWDMAARTVYACETCQPLLLVEGAQLDQRRQKALAAARDPKIFKSHCAPEGRQHQLPSQMAVAELKEALSALGLSAAGKKAGLVERLERAEAAAAQASGGVAGVPSPSQQQGKPHVASPVSAVSDAAQPSSPGDVRPGLGAACSDPVEGPEPIMGVQRLDQVEAGRLVDGQDTAPVDADLAAQEPIPPRRMTVPQLKAELKTFNMHTTGRKAELVHRLETALAAARDTGQAADHLPSSSRPAVASSSAATQQQKHTSTGRAAAGTRPAAEESDGQQAVPGQRPAAAARAAGRQSQRKRKQPAGGPAAPSASADAELRPGTAALGEPVTFEAAAREKAEAGEGRNVEHLAEVDDTLAEFIEKQKGTKKRQRS